MAKSKYWCGNTQCIWNSNRKCSMDSATVKQCDKRLKNSVILKDRNTNK